MKKSDSGNRSVANQDKAGNTNQDKVSGSRSSVSNNGRSSFDRMVLNSLLSRGSWISSLLYGARDIDRECQYPTSLTVKDYAAMFAREGFAARVVSVLPDECWSQPPVVFESEDPEQTEFERKWSVLERDRQVWHFLHRADVLSGIGSFGIVLLGLDDGKDLAEPVEEGRRERELVYLRVLDESAVRIVEWDRQITSPRFGLPVRYEIGTTDFDGTQFQQSAVPGTGSVTNPTRSLVVHWSRVIHVADNRTTSEVFGTPRMQNVFNRLLDLRKLAAGSAEMFWKGGFPGLSLEAKSVGPEVEFDEEATKAQLESYMNGLQRYLALVGMEAKSLSPQIADPDKHAKLQLQLVALALGIPWRILIGSEQGELASSQDALHWQRRVQQRRYRYLIPFVIRPFIDRCIRVGVLPQAEYQVDWRSPVHLSDADLALVAQRRTEALARYVQAGVDTFIDPFHFLTLVLGMSDEEASSVVQSMSELASVRDSANPDQGTNGIPNQGRPAGVQDGQAL